MSSTTVGLLTSDAEKTRWTPTQASRDANRKALQNSSWADGLRGIAAVFVMFSHMTLAFARYIVRPADGEHGPSQWMQRPILRLVGQGPAWVACFIILSGFVNSLKPIKLARQGNTETALSNLAVSSFRRSFRLFLPAAAATIISWFICQFGAYETARNSDAYWLQITSPEISPSWGQAVIDLIYAIRNTWLYNPENPYDQPQWALLYLLQGSMFVFMALLATINLTPRFRVMTMMICWFWSWNWGIRIGDPMVGVSCFVGIMLSELNNSEYPLRLSPLSSFFAPPMALVALVLMSFPSEFQPWAQWSKFLLEWFHKVSPENAELSRFWPTIGAQLLCLTVVLSPHMRRGLSHPWLLWLGKVSFPLYLLHGSFMRSLLSWLLFAREHLVEFEESNGDQSYIIMKYPLPGYTTFIIVMPVFFVILFTATHLWAIKVEPQFGLITKKAEDLMFGSVVDWPTPCLGAPSQAPLDKFQRDPAFPNTSDPQLISSCASSRSDTSLGDNLPCYNDRNEQDASSPTTSRPPTGFIDVHDIPITKPFTSDDGARMSPSNPSGSFDHRPIFHKDQEKDHEENRANLIDGKIGNEATATDF